MSSERTSTKKAAAKRKKKAEPIDMVVVPTDFRVPVPEDYDGDVFVWDLDKTYLRTKFESFGDLVRAIRQTAKDKVAYPGATPLLRALRRGPNGIRPIYFVSASPPQIREKILEKFAIDGVEIDGIYFKDNLRNVRPGRFKRLREQMGYKTLALLDLRSKLPKKAVETLFGDDAEADVAIYSIFSEIIEGRIANWPLFEFMMKQGVFRDEALRIAWRARRLRGREGVRRIFITVHRDYLDPRYFRRFGHRVTGTRSYFQTAMALHIDKRIAIEDVAVVAEELLSLGGMTRHDLARQLDDLRKRSVVAASDLETSATRLTELGVLSA